jgi:hypothetical protein
LISASQFRKWFKRVVLGAVLLAAAVWTGDWVWLRLKIARNSGAFGSVEVHYRYAVHLRNKRIERYTAQPKTLECVHSAFPHMNESPCWYLEKHADDLQELDGSPWHFYYQ